MKQNRDEKWQTVAEFKTIDPAVKQKNGLQSVPIITKRIFQSISF